MSSKVLSVIVPSYNMEGYLPKCLGSLVVDDGDLLRKLEVIVVNDGSTDRTSEIAHGFERNHPGVFRILDKRNGHYGSCVNAALPIASGEYVKIVDADDSVETRAFERLLSLLQEEGIKDDPADLVVTDYADVDAEGNILAVSNFGLNEGTTRLDEQADGAGRLTVHAICYRTGNLRRIGYRQTEGVAYTDTEWIIDPMPFIRRLRYLPIVVNRYLVGREGQSVDPRVTAKNFQAILDITGGLVDRYEDKVAVCVDGARGYYRKRVLGMIRMCYQFGLFGCQSIPTAGNLARFDEHLAQHVDLYRAASDFSCGPNHFAFKYVACFRKHGIGARWKMRKTLNGFLSWSAAVSRLPRRRLASLLARKAKEDNPATSENRLFAVHWRMARDALGFARATIWLLVCSAWRLGRQFTPSHGNGSRLSTEEPSGRFVSSETSGIRVLFTPSDNNAASGAFRCMVELAALLRERHGVSPLVVLPGKGSGTQLLLEAGLSFVTIASRDWTIPLGTDLRRFPNAKRMCSSMTKNRPAVSALRALIRKHGIDIVHVNTTWTYVGAVAAKEEGVPCIWHLREHLEDGLGRTMWSRSEGNRLMAGSDRAIAISRHIADKYRGVVPEPRLATVADGVDSTRFYRPGHTIFIDAETTFLFLGSFNWHKGHVEFAKACAQLHGEGVRNIRMWFVGAGNDAVKASCKEIFHAAGMDGKVTYFGYQKNPETFLEKADVAFTCSQFEGWGRVTAEAMMAGCLAIGSDSGATPELIDDGQTGLLFHYAKGECDSLVAKIKEALSDIERSRRLANAGREKAIREMTSALNADGVYRQYVEVLHPGLQSRK